MQAKLDFRCYVGLRKYHLIVDLLSRTHELWDLFWIVAKEFVYLPKHHITFAKILKPFFWTKISVQTHFSYYWLVLQFHWVCCLAFVCTENFYLLAYHRVDPIRVNNKTDQHYYCSHHDLMKVALIDLHQVVLILFRFLYEFVITTPTSSPITHSLFSQVFRFLKIQNHCLYLKIYCPSDVNLVTMFCALCRYQVINCLAYNFLHHFLQSDLRLIILRLEEVFFIPSNQDYSIT